ncbi:hypothetical protein R70006_04899 [Paraburkholderia domus]|nr:hypothetical protein R70006_04899 [Paraburkholderia domus]CAE6796042.1 hypothetical protein R75483_05121 [Paraburkholderia domus]
MSNFTTANQPANPRSIWASFASPESGVRGRPHMVQGTQFTNTRTGYANAFSARTGGRGATPILNAPASLPATPTPTVKEAAAGAAGHAEVVTPTDEVKRIASERVILMARQYAKGPHQTETALRLDMLNERLLKIAPRVSMDQVAALTTATEQLEQGIAAREERARIREERRARNQAAHAGP